MSYPTIVMMTDFGADNSGTCAMKGVCDSVCHQLVTTDVTHSIEPFNTWQASSELMYVEPFWPEGTIFVSVVDPTVGTKRRACVAKLKDGKYVVTPDNGTLTHLFYEVGVEEVREIDETINRLKGTEETSIFHGRDLFAYCAARLAAGVITYEQVGKAYPVEEIVLHDELYHPVVKENYVEGCIASAMRHFGNCFTNVSVKNFKKAGFVDGDMVKVKITHNDEVKFEQEVKYARSFGYVAVNEPVIFNGSTLVICIALNQGNFATKYDLYGGTDWRITFSK